MIPQRPQRGYRERFRRLLLADGARSVLDVGCGGGTMLRWMSKAGVAVEGLEIEDTWVERLRRDGHVVHRGRGEELPVADDAFDVVACEYVAHHFADLRAHLAEARRVARVAVWLLDPWYDLSLVSQQRMARWDTWCKRIDRRRGIVHNEALSVADFVAALPGVAMDRLEFRHWLKPVPVALDWFDEESAEHVAVATADELAELAAIRADLAENGMTDDGAIVVRIAAGTAAQSSSRSAPQ